MPPIKGQMFRYSEADMESAINECRRGVPTATAARQFGVPRITLLNKVRGKTPVKRKMGRRCYISEETENMIVGWAKEMVKRGFPVGRENLQDSVKKIVDDLNIETPFKEGRPGKRWYNSFLKRHPDLVLRQPQNLTNSRASVTTPHLKNWFEEVSTYLHENNYQHILNEPQRIFNMDETAFFLNPKGSKVLAAKGVKSVYQQINSDEKECYTVLLGGNAAGDVLPPMVIFKYERIPRELSLSVPASWGIGRSDNGWMTMETFYEYICNIFHKWLNDSNIQRPVLLFIDGHTSHLSYHVSQFCSQNGIILVALFPNATHLLQPMDVAVFRSLKGAWKNAVHAWRLENIDSPVLRKVHFCPLLNNVLKDTLSPEIFRNGFRKCGLSPWNPDKVCCVPEEPTGELSELQVMAKIKELEIGMNFLNKYINADMVTKFKNSSDWTEENEYRGLFTFYKNIEELLQLTKSKLAPTPAENLHTLNSLVPGQSSINELIPIQKADPTPPNATIINNSRTSPMSQNSRVNSPSILLSSINEDSYTCEVANQAPHSGHSLNPELSSTTEIIPLLTSGPIIPDSYTRYDSLIMPSTSYNNPKTPCKEPDTSFLNIQFAMDANTPNVPSSSKQHTMPSENSKKPTAVIPSPFKRALFWPKPKENIKKRKKEKVPSVITSLEWQTYYESKERKKIEAVEEKKRRAEERKKKKQEAGEARKLKTDNKFARKKNMKNKNKRKDSSSTEEEWIESGDSVDDISDECSYYDEENEIFQRRANKDLIIGKNITVEEKRKAEERKNKKDETEKPRKPKTDNKLVTKALKTIKNNKDDDNSSTEETENCKKIDENQSKNKGQIKSKIKQGDYLIVKFPGKKRFHKYVCIVQDVDKLDIEVMAMRACDESKTLFIENVNDISTVNESQLISVLEPPKMVITGDRIKYKFNKTLDVDE